MRKKNPILVFFAFFESLRSWRAPTLFCILNRCTEADPRTWFARKDAREPASQPVPDIRELIEARHLPRQLIFP